MDFKLVNYVFFNIKAEGGRYSDDAELFVSDNLSVSRTILAQLMISTSDSYIVS